jgi:hypothetical protein
MSGRMPNPAADSPLGLKTVEGSLSSLSSLSDESLSSFPDEKAIEDAYPEKELPSLSPPKERYHIFTSRQKWSLVFVISAAGLFSGLSSNIYFPAEAQIAQVNQTPMATRDILTDCVVGSLC